MARRQFEFELYRINLIQAEPMLFEDMSKPVRDADMISILQHAVQPSFSPVFSGPRSTFRWAVRDFQQYLHEYERGGDVYGLMLAKSVVETAGEIVTDDGIEDGVSESEPPLADTCRLFFYIKRHLVAIERRSGIINSRWRRVLEEIFKVAAQDLRYSGWVELEPVPSHEEIIEAFRSFERLTRLRVILRLPNPELSRYAAALYKEMEDGAVREYLQDMKNPLGLNKSDGKLPHAATEIAAAGYKRGQVRLEGVQNGKRGVVIKTGGTAAQGRIDQLRDYVRGMKDLAKTKEGQKVTTALLQEIDRIVPPPQKRGEA